MRNLELNAAYIEIDLANNEVYATGLADSLGQVTGQTCNERRNRNLSGRNHEV
jgi:hypothetical protein